jgi:hypothetical protein
MDAPEGAGGAGSVTRPGHGGARAVRRSPFGAAAPSISLALVYGLALMVWLAVGDRLPGGRWFAVHLFTLGVLTNVVLTFSEHFSRTVTRTPGERAAWWPVVTNLGILLVLVGLPTGERWLLAGGASIVTGSVCAAYLRIRRMRHAAVGARFAWIARVYERAHAAFVFGALLGALMGTGVVAGGWYGAARTAHLHANVLGWGGLTLLATLVFFGPTMGRTRIESGADERAARALRYGATGLSVALVLLLLTGLGGTAGTLSRVAAATGLAVYAVVSVVVTLPVGRAVWRAKPTASRPLVVAVCVWLPFVTGADVVIVATGSWRWFDALGVAALAGVLAQAMLATLVYLAPMLRGGDTVAREAIRRRLEIGTRSRAFAYQLGVLVSVLGASRAGPDLAVAAMGFSLVAVTILVTAAAALWPCGPRDRGRAARLAGSGTSVI